MFTIYIAQLLFHFFPKQMVWFWSSPSIPKTQFKVQKHTIKTQHFKYCAFAYLEYNFIEYAHCKWVVLKQMIFIANTIRCVHDYFRFYLNYTRSQ